MLANLVARAAWDLEREGCSTLRRSRSRPDRLLLRALDALERIQGRRSQRTEPPTEQAPEYEPRRVPYHVEGLLPIAEGEEAPAVSAPNPTNDEDGRWRDRLVFDPDVSDLSPIVRGTWISVSYLVSLIVDGWSWLDILRAHPELAEEDIRACLRFSTEQGEAPANWLLDQPREAGD